MRSLPGLDHRVVTIQTPTLGDRSYLVHDGELAAVIDPQRDIDRVLEVAQCEGVQIAHVFETHIHNDYLTGGLALARETGADYHVGADDEVSFARSPIRDGDVVAVSASMGLRAIATPGHTFTHLAYVLEQRPVAGPPIATAAFTGGALLFGATGRPDLLGAEHARPLARHQFASARRLAGALADDVEILPTHGFGSFCSAGSTSTENASTLGRERRSNPVFAESESAWVEATLSALDPYPAYYGWMDPANRSGPARPDLRRPSAASRAGIAGAIAHGDWVVDVRPRAAFAAAHVPGSYNLGIDGQLATYLGWLMPWGRPVVLLAETAGQLSQARRELARIGIDAVEGAATGGPQSWGHGPLASFERATFAALARARRDRPIVILDVRRASEHAAAHLADATNIPVHELLNRRADIPDGEVWVHCASGYRASIAASILAAHGRTVVAVDDDFVASAGSSGLPMRPAR